MLNYVHQLIGKCVCLLFVAEQVVLSEFLRCFSLEKAACCDQKRQKKSRESETRWENC